MTKNYKHIIIILSCCLLWAIPTMAAFENSYNSNSELLVISKDTLSPERSRRINPKEKDTTKTLKVDQNHLAHLQQMVKIRSGMGSHNTSTATPLTQIARKAKGANLNEAAQLRLADDLDGLSNGAIRELEDNFGLLDEWKQIDELSVSAQASKKPTWLQKILDGIEFNNIRSSSYPNNEVYLVNPNNPSKYVRLDSYIDNSEIVSRKYTQFSDIQESTGIKYIQELKDKYPPGAIIADVPSNKVGGSNASLENQIGTGIDGDMILEVPVQNSPIPQVVIDEANKWEIEIRDVQGTVYN